MELIFSILFVYLNIYALYILVLSLRNLKDKPFSIEKKYSKFDEEKRNFAVVIYCHNRKDGLFELVEQIKLQDYPIANFKVYAVLDDCNDGAEKLFEYDNFVHVLNIKDVGTLGKNKAVGMLLDELKKETLIDAYVFIDGTRKIDTDFLTLANTALAKADVITGNVVIDREHLDIKDRIKAVHSKYLFNFFNRARTLLGLASRIDSGLLIIKKKVIDDVGTVNFKDADAGSEYCLELLRKGYKCVFNPNIQSHIAGQDCLFPVPRLSKRLDLFTKSFRLPKSFGFSYPEYVCSLLTPNFWFIVISYLLTAKYSYYYRFFVTYEVVVFSAGIMAAAFAISLINAKLNFKEILLLMFYPLYSLGHILINFPPVRYVLRKLGAGPDKETDKLSIDVIVKTKNGDRNCRLEFISTECGFSKIRFIYKNKKYTTFAHLRMIDALGQLKSKMEDYGLTLKICSCCKNFTSCVDGSTNMLKGQCHSEFPSPLLSEPRPTLIWNSCSNFEPSTINSFIEEMANEIENQQD